MNSDGQLQPELQRGDAVRPAEALNTCWARIGVQGDGSCPELATHIHCRSCPVYARAGTSLLNRALPQDYRRAWTVRVASFRPDAPSGGLSVTMFRVGPEWLALDTALLQEVTERRPIHSLPHRRGGVVLGLANVRGELLICISLARLLEFKKEVTPTRTRHERSRILVVSSDGHRFTFPVDEVMAVHRVHQSELRPPPVTVAGAGRSFTRGVFDWRNRPVGYLDGDALLYHLSRNLL